MLSRFLQYTEDNKLLCDGQRVLLAVSGGADSVTMAQLFNQTKYKIGIAHCNFKLRGRESDDDENFVKNLSDQLKIPFFCMHFNTEEFAQLEKISIQSAARQLRYNWFENLRRQNGYDKIAVAHNADDSVETFFINLIRGTGIQGITGIKPKIANIIRPLLFAHRDEIEQYCKQNEIEYRTDSSNNSDKYLRNRIRHNLIPVLNNLAPNFKSIMLDNLTRFTDAEYIYTDATQAIVNDVIENHNEMGCDISIPRLIDHPAPKTILYEILKDYQFSPKTSEEIYSNIKGISGQTYFSENFRVIKDREKFIIRKIDEEISKEQKFYIDPTNDLMEDLPVHFQFSFIENENFQIPTEKNIAAIDANKLQFPLLLRKWRPGDYFQPIGMKGMKKLSDFFIDNKISLAEKENTWLLTSANEIVWIVGMRIDNRFKISRETKRILKVELH